MKAYKSHKIVHAARISEFDKGTSHILVYIGDNDIKAMHVPNKSFWDSWDNSGRPVHGYVIEYPDGYVSFSPIDAFETGYSEYDPKADVPGLPVKGYKDQPSEAVIAVNQHKDTEERLYRRIETLNEWSKTGQLSVDPRLAALAKTNFEIGFMLLNKAVFQPARHELPEDKPQVQRAEFRSGEGRIHGAAFGGGQTK